LAQKAGRSSGLRLATRPRSTTTSRSTQLAPAFLRSVFSALRCQDLDRHARFAQSLQGLGELRLLEAVGRDAHGAGTRAPGIGSGTLGRSHPPEPPLEPPPEPPTAPLVESGSNIRFPVIQCRLRPR
jgi:hypothetical protein